MKRPLYFTLSLTALIFWSSCRQDFIFTPSSGNLSFAKDTVYLVTVFSNIGSSTYTLKVYNTTNDDILIPSIKLREGQNSNYRMNVDGLIGNATSTTTATAAPTTAATAEPTSTAAAEPTTTAVVVPATTSSGCAYHYCSGCAYHHCNGCAYHYSSSCACHYFNGCTCQCACRCACSCACRATC